VLITDKQNKNIELTIVKGKKKDKKKTLKILDIEKKFRKTLILEKQSKIYQSQ